MTTPHYLNPEGVPTPSGRYSQISVVPQGVSVATFAGQVGIRSSGEVPPGAAEQARLVFAGVEALLASQGATPAHLIRLLTLVVGRENLTGFNAVRDEVYSRWFPEGRFPPNTLMLAAGLAVGSLLVEIEGSFVCPRPGT